MRSRSVYSIQSASCNRKRALCIFTMLFIMIIVRYVMKLVNGKWYYPMGRGDRENACFSQKGEEKKRLRRKNACLLQK